jgi:hypothetical protein
VPAFQSQVLKIIAPQEKLIMANTNIKSGVVLGGMGLSSRVGAEVGAGESRVDGASIASAVTFDTFENSFASFKDLNKTSFVRGVDLEDSIYDGSVVAPSGKKKIQVINKNSTPNSNSKKIEK